MKIKSLLAAALIFFTFMPSATINAAQSKNEAAYDFIAQLGIADDINLDNTKVTRAEFTAMAVRCMNVDFMADCDDSFRDVKSDTPFVGEIYTARNLKIVNGTSYDTFSPESGVTYGVAVKILVTALGYEQLALANGGYPVGYMTVANNIKLLQGVKGENTSKITMQAALRLIYNALKTDLYLVSGILGEDVTYTKSYGKNFLTENFGYTKISGVVQTAGYISMIPGFSYSERYININGVEVKCSRDDEEKYLGLSCDVYYDSIDMIFAAAEVLGKNNITTVQADEVSSYSDFSLRACIETSDCSYNMNRGFSFVLNGRAISAQPDDFQIGIGMLTLIDNDGDNAYDVVLADKKEYFVISSVSSGSMIAYDKNLRSTGLAFKDTDDYGYTIEIYDFASGTKRKAEFDELLPDMVAEVYESRDKKLIRVLATSRLVNGVATEYDSEDVTIDGISYKKNEYFKANDKLLRPGLSADYLIAPDGTLTYVGKLSPAGTKYGYFLGYSQGKSFAMKEAQIKVLTSSNEVCVFGLRERVMLDGVSGVKTTDDSFKNKFMNGEYPRYQLIRYSEKDGIVDIIDTAEDVSGSEDLFTKYRFSENTNNSLTKVFSKTSIYYTGGKAAPYFSLAGTVIFQIPSEMKSIEPGTKKYGDDMFACVSESVFDPSPRHDVDAFDYNESFSVGAVLSYDTVLGSGTSERLDKTTAVDASFIVEEVRTASDIDGYITARVYLCGGDGYVNYLISSKYYDTLSALSLIPESGDIVRIKINANNEIIYISRDATYADGKLTVKYGIDDIKNTVGNIFTYVSGKVLAKSSVGFSLITDNYPSDSITMGSDGITSYRINTSKNVVIIYDLQTKKARRAEISDIADAQSVGIDNASYLCSRVNYLNSNIMFIYEKQGVQ